MSQSDIPRFLQALKQANPNLESEQRKGRAIWWDKPQDPDTQRRNGESRINQTPYVYQVKG